VPEVEVGNLVKELPLVLLRRVLGLQLRRHQRGSPNRPMLLLTNLAPIVRTGKPIAAFSLISIEEIVTRTARNFLGQCVLNPAKFAYRVEISTPNARSGRSWATVTKRD